ncbi:MAG: TlpA family protein disulfide reductase [Acidimicrobiia bacterium]|nr:TlpA family protein disulfide reductase [Acidimicrobiia bacterium]
MSKKKNRKKRPPTPAASTAASPSGGGATARQQALNRTPTKSAQTAKKGRPTPGRSGAIPPRPSRRAASGAMSWVVLGLAIVLIVGVVVFFAVSADDSGGEGITTADGWDLPALDDVGDEDGDGRVTLAEFEGTPTVVNFFASWCVECERELPAFAILAEELEGDIDFVFANSNETGNWRPMAERGGIEEYPIVQDIGGTQRNGLYRSVGGTGGMPITAFYDAEGNLVFTNPGGMTVASVQETLIGLGLL